MPHIHRTQRSLLSPLAAPYKATGDHRLAAAQSQRRSYSDMQPPPNHGHTHWEHTNRSAPPTLPYASVSLPPPYAYAQTPLTLGVKHKSFYGTCATLDIDPHYRISGLETQVGRRYLCTRAQRRSQGSSGKMRYAMDTHGRLLMAKEVRTETAFARAMAQRKPLKTMMTPRAAICREVALLQMVEPTLKVHDFIDVDGKIFVIMDAMYGDFSELMGGAPDARCFLVRSMLAQIAASLQRCHASGFIHHDVKVDNILWGDDCKMVLADYGLSLAHQDAQTRAVPVQHMLPVNFMQIPQAGPPGTYPAPEMCLPHPHTGRFTYDHRIDTWALGMAFVMSFTTWDVLPFRRWRTLTDCGQYHRLQADIDSYTRWHQQVVNDDGRLNGKKLFARRRPGDPRRKWDDCFRPLHDVDPKLLAFVLRYMLHPRADKRASLSAIELYCQQLADDCSEQSVRAARQLFVTQRRKAEPALRYPKEALRSVFQAAIAVPSHHRLATPSPSPTPTPELEPDVDAAPRCLKQMRTSPSPKALPAGAL